MSDFHTSINSRERSSRADEQGAVFGGPNDVLDDVSMTRDEKRAVLASWASDAHAVPGQPSLRQVDDGSIVSIDDILSALNALDAAGDVSDERAMRRREPYERRLTWSLRKGLRTLRRRRSDDDDDDPPPCPAHAAIPPKRGGGDVFASPELALA